MNNIPFVGLHAHTGIGSIFDGLGKPEEHFDFAYSNGADAMAITEHGNCNSLPYAVAHVKKMRKEGKNFKYIMGVEAYFIPSIADWRVEYEKNKLEKKAVKDDEAVSGATVEDENASKKEIKSLLNRRRHLVLLAQNQKGLNNIFKLISESYKTENYYRYPRMDFDMLEKYNEGVIALSACITADAIIDTNQGQICMKELVEKVNSGEEIFVLSYDENIKKLVHQKVIWADLTRKNAKLVKIKLKDGKELRLTPDHKVYTDKGWMKAEDLKNHKNIKILSLK
jgi:DNA polymerase III alpha subunit